MDDTELYLEGNFEEAVLTINDFGNKSGLFFNTGKTNAVCLGSKINSPVRYMHMEWNPLKKLRFLGSGWQMIWGTVKLSTSMKAGNKLKRYIKYVLKKRNYTTE